MTQNIFSKVLLSPIGPLTIISDHTHLLRLRFGAFEGGDSTPLLRNAAVQLIEYFSGQRQEFSLPLRPTGTAFQQRVWAELRKIPYGTSISYRQLAEAAGTPKGFQAVGAANKANPLPIFIPCHRVISADGHLGGYSAGTICKSFLLHLEGCTYTPSAAR